MDWRHKAACLDEDPHLFFPIGTTGPAIEQTDRAKAVCARCHVRTECLKWVMDTNQQDGIWGGLDEHERAVLHRRQRRQKH
jgi:WhiB family transcriptional regulator, redox-sensing transcriptional regulator